MLSVYFKLPVWILSNFLITFSYFTFNISTVVSSDPVAVYSPSIENAMQLIYSRKSERINNYEI